LLIKLKHLKDDALIYENKIAFTGITGHKVKKYTTIRIDGYKIKHALHVKKDYIPIKHDGILEINFLCLYTVVAGF